MFSIDGIGDKFEYLRHPGKWKDLIDTFESALNHSNIYTPVCYTVSVFNVMHMNEFIKWFKSYGLHDDALYFNLIFNPETMCIQNLNKNHKEEIKQHLETTITGHKWLDLKVKEVVDFMIKDSLKSKSIEFVNNTRRLDLIRGENFEKSFPELAKVLKDIL
jgi:MoaA/NifB/PqqE/SkfB family radical SAM enzyme